MTLRMCSRILVVGAIVSLMGLASSGSVWACVGGGICQHCDWRDATCPGSWANWHEWYCYYDEEPGAKECNPINHYEDFDCHGSCTSAVSCYGGSPFLTTTHNGESLTAWSGESHGTKRACVLAANDVGSSPIQVLGSASGFRGFSTTSSSSSQRDLTSKSHDGRDAIAGQ